MDCKQMREVMDLYIDGELSVEATTVARAHLTECAGCTHVADQLLGMRSALKRVVEQHEPPLELVEHIRYQHLRMSRLRFLKLLDSGRLPSLFIRSAAIMLAMLISIGIVGVFSPPVRGYLADGLERVALHVDGSRRVVLEGELLCRDCRLHERYGAPSICPRRGHHGALKTADGKIWNFIDEDTSEPLIHDQSLLGRKVRVQGRFYREADSIWVDKYELL